MDDALGGPLMTRLGSRLGSRVLLWRSRGVGGRDIDVLVLSDAERELAELLATAGLEPEPRRGGRVVWRSRAAHEPTIDTLPSRAWRADYPSLSGVLRRSEHGGGLPPRVSAADLLLILGVEAVEGLPADRIVQRARALLTDPAAVSALRAVADDEGMRPIADLIAKPEGLAAATRRGRLPYAQAAAVALKSPHARRALTARLVRRVRAAGVVGTLERRRDRSRELLIALSGMDGAGKSTAAQRISGRLTEAGRPADIAWGRLGTNLRALDRAAGGVKRVLRRDTTVGDPVATGGSAKGKRRHPAEMRGRRPFVSWLWVLVVAGAHARFLRRASVARKRGVTVVCDRSVVDSLVDLEIRYGPHRAARALLSVVAPTPDLGILLEIDAETAARRQPGDQAMTVLEAMEARYRSAGERHAFVSIDARAPLPQIQERIDELVDSMLQLRENGSRPGVAATPRDGTARPPSSRGS